MSKEITIDKKTNIRHILNKEECEILTLKCRVNPKKLKDFTNVKELIIDYIEKRGTNYNERNINSLPFKDNIEKLVFKTFYSFGRDRVGATITYYRFDLPNLKSIEFPSFINNYYQDYLEKITTLEEIIFNFNNSTKSHLDGVMYTFSNDIKKIIIKYYDKEYVIEPKYKIGCIDDLDFDIDKNEISLDYSDSYTYTEIYIKTKDDVVREDNDWEIHAKDNIIYIPDYATSLNDYVSSGVKKISLNLNLLNNVEENDQIIYYLDDLKKIELRSNNEMSLMSKKEIDLTSYGELRDLYIKDHLLVLEYQNFDLNIDSKGKIKKIEKPKEFEDVLNDYSLEELEMYASYLRLLKVSKEHEYQEAMKVVEKILIKKYPKFDK